MSNYANFRVERDPHKCPPENLPELEDPNDPWSRQDKCGMCFEPGEVVNGVFVHAFTGKERCTYKSHL